MIRILVICFINLSFCISQQDKLCFYIEDKGLYINIDSNEKKTMFPHKENLDFYFSIKNDSIALIQEILKDIPQVVKEYKISNRYDTVYIKQYFIEKGEKKLNGVEKRIYRKVSE